MKLKCPICKKHFFVLYPQLWVYKRRIGAHERFICSWHCLRAYDRKGENIMKKCKVTHEQKERAVQIALDGGDPLQYLETCGATNPQQMWYMIKGAMKDNDPETYEKLPKRIVRKYGSEPEVSLADAMAGMKDAADKFFGEALHTESPFEEFVEENFEPAQETDSGSMSFRITGIMTEIGDFQYYKRNNYMDWEPVGCPSELVSLNIDEWKQLLRDLPKIMEILGVEV